MVNGVSGVPGRLVLKPVAEENQQERECATILLLLMVDLTVQVTLKRAKIAIPKLVPQVIQNDTTVRLNIGIMGIGNRFHFTTNTLFRDLQKCHGSNRTMGKREQLPNEYMRQHKDIR